MGVLRDVAQRMRAPPGEAVGEGEEGEGGVGGAPGAGGAGGAGSNDELGGGAVFQGSVMRRGALGAGSEAKYGQLVEGRREGKMWGGDPGFIIPLQCGHNVRRRVIPCIITFSVATHIYTEK